MQLSFHVAFLQLWRRHFSNTGIIKNPAIKFLIHFFIDICIRIINEKMNKELDIVIPAIIAFDFRMSDFMSVMKMHVHKHRDAFSETILT